MSVYVTHVCMLDVHMGECVCIWFRGHVLPDLISCGHMYACICWTTQGSKYKDELGNQVLFS